ncbi:EpsG family protein [Chromohalobacter israelensis]|uniref:Uncharacterized protein n=1 Tax=Chromohalobacter israelensis (strain ATCC BAA-138 / DSM 3043 / CIP 106854 / NCIMB 13768 / 1H11) TaxID=290398 RepID=Q1QWW7_CHRI1|nr:EpsG family protein [Chromohalobacter salexigens]ABE59041.1 hypothetical protein Csal_1689 [Chromohalobacter salexigens DSM 3043]
MTYFLAYSFLWLSAALSLCVKNTRGVSVLFYCAVSFLFYMASFLRWDVGTDWDGYYRFYGKLDNFDFVTQQGWWEPAYAFIAYFSNALGNGFTFFLFLISTMVAFGKLLIVRWVPGTALFVLLLFSVNFYDVFFVRQNVSAVFISVSLLFFIEKKYAGFLIFTLVATLFHYGALLVSLMGVGIAVFRAQKNVLKIFLSGVVIPIALVCAALIVKQKYGVYLAEKASDASKEGNFIRNFLKCFYWYAILFLSGKVSSLYDRQKDIFFLVYLIISLSLLGSLVSDVFTRLIIYVYPLIALIVSTAIVRSKVSKRSLYWQSLLVFIFAGLPLNFYMLISGYSDLYIPYETIWSNK